MQIRAATPQDFAGILELQHANLRERLNAEQRREGYLSASFSPAQLAAFAENLGIIVAHAEAGIAGYMCASTKEFDSGSPIVEALVRSLEGLAFGDLPLAQARVCIYGPVCIAAAYRHRGLLQRLFTALKARLAGRFDVGVGFIAAANPHSFEAHTHGLGMVRIGGYEQDGKAFHIVAFALAALP